MMENKLGFRVEVDESVDNKINWLTQNYPKEISGWLVGEFNKDTISITDILFPHQEVGGSSVDTTGGDFIKLRKEYGDKCLSIIGHFHSHNTMGNFWSQTDEEFISQYMEQRDKAIFIVSSKTNGHRVRLELKNPLNISIDELDYNIMTGMDEALSIEMGKVIVDKLTESEVIVTQRCQSDLWGYSGYGNYSNGYGNEDGYFDGYDYRTLEDLNGENLGEGISDEINNMIIFNKHNNGVTITDLTFSQYGQLEDLGNHTTAQAGDKFIMKFTPKNKKEAINIMREAKAFLMDDISVTRDYNDCLEGSY